jgi:hypothetical protein
VGSGAENVGREYAPESMIVGSWALLILMAKSKMREKRASPEASMSGRGEMFSRLFLNS